MTRRVNTVKWIWPLASLGGGVDGGAMSKLFRGGALSDAALLAREAIQNSNDAHDEFRKSHPEVPFKVVFRFVHLFGDEKTAAVEALDLRGMERNRATYGRDDPLQPGSVLDSMDDSRVPLQLLYVEDYGTHGLFGDPVKFKKSHLFMAMYYIGTSDKPADAGGLFGFGKSALQRASRTRSVLTHTVFEQQGDDPVRSRLLGFTWWPDLQDGDDLRMGRGSFSNHRASGSGQEGVPTPFADRHAREVADALGFQARDPERPEELGTSFLIVDPSVSPEELLHEIERWWWPALEERNLDVQVVLPSGETKVPRPAANPFVGQFVRAFRIAIGVDEPIDANKERLASNDWRNRSGAGGKDLGKLGLVLSEPGVQGAGDDIEQTPVVALTRGPRMVVEYLKPGTRRRVPLRGVFVASDEANKLLSKTEPSTHDRWTTNASSDIPAEATDTAEAVLTKIRTSVAKMAKEIAPAPPKKNKSLGHFSKLMNGFLGNKRGGPNPPPPGGEKFELKFPNGRPAPEVLDDAKVRVKTQFTVRVSEDAPNTACKTNVTCQLFIFEDDAMSQSRWPVKVKPVSKNHGFRREEDGTWSGPLTKGDKVVFEVVSDPYSNLWTTSLKPTVTRTGEWSDR